MDYELNSKINISEIWEFFTKLGKALGKVGGISLLLTVITFWIIQYNNYVQIGNSIRAETAKNIVKLNFVNQDTNKSWAYTNTLSSISYDNNWNFITQYYDLNCIQDLFGASINIGTINTLILQRQSGNNVLNQDTLYTTAEKLNPQLQRIISCPIKPWHSRIVNKFY